MRWFATLFSRSRGSRGTLLQAATFLFPSVRAPITLPGVSERHQALFFVAQILLWGYFGAGVWKLSWW